MPPDLIRVAVARFCSAYKRQSERPPRFFSCFCSSGDPVHPRLYITLGSFFFFFYTAAPATRVIVEFQRGTSFRNPRQWRRGFAGTKTFLRRLKSHSTRSPSFSPALKRKTLRLPFFARYRIIGVASARVTVRDRVPSFALHVDLAVNSWILSIAISEIPVRKIEETWNEEKWEIRMWYAHIFRESSIAGKSPQFISYKHFSFSFFFIFDLIRAFPSATTRSTLKNEFYFLAYKDCKVTRTHWFFCE